VSRERMLSTRAIRCHFIEVLLFGNFPTEM
jgi:hypothetical protein